MLSGQVHGGQQPVSGSRVFLYAVATNGYSGTATSLLNGGYVTTDAGGGFNISGSYTCPAGAYVYMVALGGNPGLVSGTNNSKLGLMAGLGACSSLASTPYISINEVTTVAAAYALSAFMSSETLAGTSAANTTGLKNAFATIPNLVSGNGFALATTPAGNGTVPQAEIDTLANVLASCVNSDGTGTACSSLMTAANVAGANGTPIDTIQAALNIAHSPGTNAATLYGLASATGPFQPTLAAVPTDFTLAVDYSGGVNQSQGMAIDAVGNIWLSNYSGNNLTEFSPAGVLLTGTGGVTTSSLLHPQRLAIDLTGNVWVAGGPVRDPNNGAILTNGNIQEFASNGATLSGTLGYNNACVTNPIGVAFDQFGNIWSGNGAKLCQMSSAGALLSPAAGVTGGGLQTTFPVLNFDPFGHLWVSSYAATLSSGTFYYTGAISEFNGNSALSPSGGGYPGGSLTTAFNSAIDHVGNIWVSNYGDATNSTAGHMSKFSNAGAALSPSAGYGSIYLDFVTIDGAGRVYGSAPGANGTSPTAALLQLSNDGTVLSPASGFSIPNGGFNGAIDGSGNLWMGGLTTLEEIVGIAAPVVTPVLKAVSTNTLGVRP